MELSVLNIEKYYYSIYLWFNITYCYFKNVNYEVCLIDRRTISLTNPFPFQRAAMAERRFAAQLSAAERWEVVPYFWWDRFYQSGLIINETIFWDFLLKCSFYQRRGAMAGMVLNLFMYLSVIWDDRFLSTLFHYGPLSKDDWFSMVYKYSIGILCLKKADLFICWFAHAF